LVAYLSKKTEACGPTPPIITSNGPAVEIVDVSVASLRLIV